MKNTRRIFLIMIAYLLYPIAADATLIEFDLTYDGATIVVDPGSAVPAGTSLSAGDSFNLELRADGSDFWRVEAPYDNQAVPLSFFVLDSGTRTANIETLFLLDGVLQTSILDVGINQSSVHIGAQIWSLGVGLEFDTVVMNYDLLASTAATTIQAVPNIFEDFGVAGSPFFTSEDISYNRVSVPEPGTLALFGIGLIGMGLARRRKA